MKNLVTLETDLLERERKLRTQVEKILIEAADHASLPIFYDEIVVMSSHLNLVAGAAVVNGPDPLSILGQDIAFLFIRLNGQLEIDSAFYTLRVFSDLHGGIDPQALLVDLDGFVQKTVTFALIDPFEGDIAPRPGPAPDQTQLLAISRRDKQLLIHGRLRNGKYFLVSLDLD